MKKLFLVLVMVLIPSLVLSYTFDGDVDPVQFFSYEAVSIEQTSPQTMIVCIKSNNMNPLFAVMAVVAKDGNAYIIAYAYYDKMVLRHFILEKSHYFERIPDPDTIKMLEKKLNRLKGLSKV